MILFVFGTMFMMVVLVVTLITYGFIADNTDAIYSKTTCWYNGYQIIEKECGIHNAPYTGLLKLYFIPNNTNKNNTNTNNTNKNNTNTNNTNTNNTVYRSLQMTCGSKEQITLYFDVRYKNGTHWFCWYDKLDSVDGWIGFSPPYNVNGNGMIAAGFAIFATFIIMTVIYLIISHKRNVGGYYYVIV